MREVRVARIGAAHGVRGEVRLWPFTQDPMAVAGYGPLETEDGARHFDDREPARRPRIIWWRASTASNDREAAEALRNLELFVPRERLPAIEERRHVLPRRPDRAGGGDGGRRRARHGDRGA